MPPRRLALVVSSLVIAACGLFPSVDGLSGGDASLESGDELPALPDAGDASEASEAAADTGACPSAAGPAMVHVPIGDGGFCIDSTEVTTTDYAAFLDAVSKGAPVATPPSGVCNWNGSILPSTSGSCTTDTDAPDAHPSRPVACVNWCDAYAYCAWAGKRLCGAIDGGALPFASVIGPANQQYVACSANTTQPYPYGQTYVKGNCNTKDLYDGGAKVADVKQFSACVGAFPGIYDIVGNVEEWVDSCDDQKEGGATDHCHEQGDCFDYTATGPARCDNDDSDPRTYRGADVGIRCCSP
jgi:sulfatase modifying factor 1